MPSSSLESESLLTFDKSNQTWEALKSSIRFLPETHRAGDLDEAVRMALDPVRRLGIFYQVEQPSSVERAERITASARKK